MLYSALGPAWNHTVTCAVPSILPSQVVSVRVRSLSPPPSTATAGARGEQQRGCRQHPCQGATPTAFSDVSERRPSSHTPTRPDSHGLPRAAHMLPPRDLSLRWVNGN